MPGDLDFRMTVEDVFFIRGRGTVVTGIISQGKLYIGDSVTLNTEENVKTVQVTGIEVFHRRIKCASAGERVGIFLKPLTKDEVSRGDMLVGSGQHDDIWWEVENG